LGSVLVPLAVGAVFHATSSFLAAFLTLATGPLVGLLLMLGVNEKRAELSTKMRS
jgi:MFS-type transporter involved in bile tolerance (Atg22 family)